jgi:putative lipoic acid-binding regulatory protein
MPELTFPLEYPVKVIGKNEDDFASHIMKIIACHVPGLPLDAFTTNRSRGGKYLSVSVTFIAESRTQVDALYTALAKDTRVLTAL